MDAKSTAALAKLEADQSKIALDERHRYTVNVAGTWKSFPSVTTIIGALAKPALERWKLDQERHSVIAAAFETPRFEGESLVEYTTRLRQELGKMREAERVAASAAAAGSTIHAAIEAFLRKELGLPYKAPAGDRLTPEVRAAFGAWRDWYQASGLTPVALERRMADRRLEVAGTFDALMLDRRGRLTLVDWKTAADARPVYKPWSDWILQSAAYRGTLATEYGFSPAAALIVKIARDGSGLVEVPLEDDFAAGARPFAPRAGSGSDAAPPGAARGSPGRGDS